MKITFDEVLKLIESAPDKAAIEGIVNRYSEWLTNAKGSERLVARLDQRRTEWNRWKGLVNVITQLFMATTVNFRAELETAIQAVLKSQGMSALKAVSKEHPLVFSGSFLTALAKLQEHARLSNDAFTEDLVNNRLRHLQLLHLANSQGFELDERTIRDLVYRVFEVRNFKDLLQLVSDNPVLLAEAFDQMFVSMAADAAREGKTRLPGVAELRVGTFNGIRRVVESIVLRRKAEGGLEEAVAALGEATSADQFLNTVARFPFVLGEDFGQILREELEKAEADGESKVVEGLERRIGHLELINTIIEGLTSSSPPQEQGG